MKMNDIQQQLKTLNTTMEGKMNEILKNNPSVNEYNDLSKQVESLTSKIDSLTEVIENAKESKTYEIVTENTPKLKVYQDLLNELGNKKAKAYNALNKCLERENYTELNDWEREYQAQRQAILKPLKQELIDTYKHIIDLNAQIKKLSYESSSNESIILNKSYEAWRGNLAYDLDLLTEREDSSLMYLIKQKANFTL
jgi:chromosome segregation ATPase